MPADYVQVNGEPVIPDFCRVDSSAQLRPYNLYFASFNFPVTELFPSIAVRSKVNGALVCPLNSTDNLWLWGCELIYAMERGAMIFVQNVIEYVPLYTHKSFIEDSYKRRQEAKRAGDAGGDAYFKLKMNAQYGRHGMKTYQRVEFGDLQFAKHTYSHLTSQSPGVITDISVTRVQTSLFPLYEIRYTQQG